MRRSTSRRVLLLLALPALLAAGCRGEEQAPTPAPPPAARVDTSPKAIPPKAKAVMDVSWTGKKLGKTVHTAVVEGVKKDGALASMGRCDDAKVVEQLREFKGADVGRATLKPRNPANQGPPWVREFLAKDEPAGDISDLKSMTEIVAVEGGDVARFLRRIRIGDGCLGCHGPVEAMDADVVAFLQDEYPRDRAVGYTSGAIMGVVWAQKAVAGPPTPAPPE